MEYLLNKLVINNQKLEKLESKINKFNPLRVLKVDEYEIRHSNILSWLLDPNENHGLGEIFFEKFVGQIILLNEESGTEISILDIYLKNFYDLQLFREKDNIDILAVSHVNKFVLLIENKIKAKEMKGQLLNYSNTIDSKYSDYKKVKVFLTIDGEKPSLEEYLVCDYASILSILIDIMELKESNLNNKVEDFINYYIEVLKDLLEEDKETLTLCKEIYKENIEIIDYIFKNIKNFEEKNGGVQEKILSVYNIYEKSLNMIRKHGVINPFYEATNRFLSDNDSLILIKGLNSYSCIIRDDMLEISDLSNVMDPVYCLFDNKLRYNKLFYYIEIQNFGDNHILREKLLHKLEDQYRFKINKASYSSESRFTRVYSKSCIIQNVTEENILKEMKILYKESEGELKKVIEAGKKVLEENNQK